MDLRKAPVKPQDEEKLPKKKRPGIPGVDGTIVPRKDKREEVPFTWGVVRG